MCDKYDSDLLSNRAQYLIFYTLVLLWSFYDILKDFVKIVFATYNNYK